MSVLEVIIYSRCHRMVQKNLRIMCTLKHYASKPTTNNTQDAQDNGFFIQSVGKKDMVGPPDPVSNIRPILFHISSNESELERNYRIQCEDVQKWNQEFWKAHNSNFFKERDKFIKECQNKKGLKENEALSADEMSIFYKTFLDDNWMLHARYNKEWYVKNIGLMLFSLRVKLFRIIKRYQKL